MPELSAINPTAILAVATSYYLRTNQGLVSDDGTPGLKKGQFGPKLPRIIYTRFYSKSAHLLHRI